MRYPRAPWGDAWMNATPTEADATSAGPRVSIPRQVATPRGRSMGAALMAPGAPQDDPNGFKSRIGAAIQGLGSQLNPNGGGIESFLSGATGGYTNTQQGLRERAQAPFVQAQAVQDHDLYRRNIESQIQERNKVVLPTTASEWIPDETDPNYVIQVDRDRQGNRVPAMFNGKPIRKTVAQARASSANINFDNVAGLRREFNQIIVPHQVVARSAQAIEEAAANPSAAGDLSLIFAFMKVLDPGSTVREGEFANAQNAGSVPSRVQALYNRVMSGERLSTEQRADFLAQSRGLVKSQRSQARQYIDRYSKLATQYGFDPTEVVTDPYDFGTPAPSSPPPARRATDKPAIPPGYTPPPE